MFYFFLGPAIILLKVRKELVTRLSLPRNAPEIKKRQFGQRKYYIITNQRSLIFEQGAIHDYSLILMADAVIGKPKGGASSINLYYSTNPTGQLPEPVFQLKGIEEEEAQAAYEILRQAREEALEDRAREMGIE
jgi:hypothetical protein